MRDLICGASLSGWKECSLLWENSSVMLIWREGDGEKKREMERKRERERENREGERWGGES